MRVATTRTWLWLIVALAAATPTPAVLAADDWPRFRGPNGEGVATAPGLPATWGAKDYAWQATLPGVGHSSPVVLGKRLFVTAGSEDGTARRLVCLDTASGKSLWTQTLALSRDKLHQKNSYASGTPAVTDEFVYVIFADDERYVVAAYRLDGKRAWEKDLGPFVSQHGQGCSPIVWHDLVIVANDQDGPSSLVALDAKTGETRWSTPRTAKDTSYSTPFVLEAKDGPPQLIASCNALGVTSLDPRTGRVNWASGELPQRTVGSPVLAGKLVIQTCGQAGRGTYLLGVDPFAKDAAKRVAYEQKKTLPYVPTPVSYKDHLYLWNDDGVVVCLDEKKDFANVWTKRVGGKNYSSSPVCVNGLLYAVSEEGEVFVVKASPNYECVGQSSLGEASYATPAVADGKMFFRTFTKVLCLAPNPPAT